MLNSYYNSSNNTQLYDYYLNKKKPNVKKQSSFSSVSTSQSSFMDRNTRKILQSTSSDYYSGGSNGSNSSLWDSRTSSLNSLNTCDFSYRNEKKYYELLEKHRIRQDKIKKLSTRTPNIISNNELGIKNKPDTADRLPKITKASYQVLSGFCQRNCPLQSAKEIINVNYYDEYEKEYRKKVRAQRPQYRHQIKKIVSYPIIKQNEITKNINQEIKDLENSIIQKSLQNLVNCARRTGRGLFCGV